MFSYYLRGEMDEATISAVVRLSMPAGPAGLASMVEVARSIARKDGRQLIAQDLIVAASY